MQQNWHEVVRLYETDPNAQSTKISTSGYTALHVAVADGKDDIVYKLVASIKSHISTIISEDMTKSSLPSSYHDYYEDDNRDVMMFRTEVEQVANASSSPLGIQNEKGNTALHLAAAIDLAFQIIKSYKHLASTNNINVEGKAPLHVLADKPSAFKSAIKLGIWKSIIYKCIKVEKQKDQNPANNTTFTCFNFLRKLVKIAKKKEDPKYVKKKVVKKRETAMLIAARNGITEMVKRILEKFPVAIYDSNEDEKNVVLLALEYKQFVRNSMPENFFVEYNDKGETPETIFTKDHKNLVKSGSEWMSKTAESCSLVAALIATVAFATSTSLPGGTNEENGKPMLANQPAFRVFAVASLIALSFSVTSLVMFLTILTSRFSENNFEKILPWKLLMGLTSLFLAIVSMIIAFCAGHFFVLNDSIKVAAFPVYAVTAIPISFFAAAQFPLYVDLVFATFASPFGNPQNIIDPE
ncbi:hypothetical protein G4B88_019293 [Cannabis sativa]|uniref:PGG domain-containing protein n=1 Tax=Cannabis sativa TaxID=3483 RepID=A0A7J6DVN4_CANSA|nr:hypothetical protein G4B88_019293 [Cannabis sativa]